MQLIVGNSVAGGVAAQAGLSSARSALGDQNGNAPGPGYYNFPPGLRFVHYDPAELDSSAAVSARLLAGAFVLTFISCVVSLVNSFISFSAGGPWKNAAYSIFNLFLVPGLALALFQSGYNAFHKQAPSSLAFLAAQAVAAFAFFCAGLGFGPFHGLFTIYEVRSSFWVMVSLGEGLLWLAGTGLGVYIMHRARKYEAPPFSGSMRSGAAQA
jgi:hypothetical protein